MRYRVRAAPRLGLSLDEFPKVKVSTRTAEGLHTNCIDTENKGWVERIEQRPAVQTGLTIPAIN